MYYMKFPLFVYGQLCVGDTRPITAWGEMRYLPGQKDAACRFGTEYVGRSVVYGQLVQKTMPELEALDKMEAYGEPEWERRRITLTDGTTAFAYYYAGPHESPAWEDLEPAPLGVWLNPRA